MQIIDVSSASIFFISNSQSYFCKNSTSTLPAGYYHQKNLSAANNEYLSLYSSVLTCCKWQAGSQTKHNYLWSQIQTWHCSSSVCGSIAGNPGPCYSLGLRVFIIHVLVDLCSCWHVCVVDVYLKFTLNLTLNPWEIYLLWQ